MYGYIRDIKNIIKNTRIKKRDKPKAVLQFSFLRALTFARWFAMAFIAFLFKEMFTATVRPFTSFILSRWNMAAVGLAVRLGIPQV